MTSGSRGFTLVEVLVALAVVSLGLIAVLGQMNQAVTTATLLNTRTVATWVGANVLTQARLGGVRNEPGESEGEAEMAGQTWRWRLTVTAVADEQLQGVNRLDVYVSSPDDPERVIASLAGLSGPGASVADSRPAPWITEINRGGGIIE